MIIQVPRFQYEPIHAFIEELYANIDYPNIVYLSFKNLTYTFPFPMLIAGSAIRNFRRNREKNGLITHYIDINNSVSSHSYLMHLGFFNFIGSTYGKKIGDASGSLRYLPIKVLQRDQLLTRVQYPYRMLRHVIYDEAKSIGRLILNKDCNEHIIISYCIREIIRNVFEHSESNFCFICGQKWSDGNIELAILDEGVGIRHTLSNKYDYSSDIDAIHESLQPGISCRDFDSPNNIHDNSGFGLYVLSEIGKRLGWFSIGSGSARLFLSNKEERIDNLFHKGTFVGLHLKKYPQNFENELKEIINNGNFEAQIMGRNIQASSSSQIFY